mgnify:CR=1 FL=1
MDGVELIKIDVVSCNTSVEDVESVEVEFGVEDKIIRVEVIDGRNWK